jgi:ABC-2 type transport system permease protein
VSTLTTAAGRHSDRAAQSRGGGFRDILRSEWTKFRSVRSTYWTLAAAVVSTVGLAAAISAGFVHSANQNDLATTDLTQLTLTGVLLSQLAIGVLGVLVISSEYTTGMIRTTLTAVPRRGVMLAGKVTVFAGALLIGATATAFVSFVVGRTILSAKVAVSLGDPGVLRAVVGAGLYLTMVGLLGLGLGTIIRHSAGAIAALVGLLLVVTIVVVALPSSLSNRLWPYLPANAGGAIMQTQHSAHTLSPWTGFALFTAYAAAALLTGATLLTRRDA